MSCLPHEQLMGETRQALAGPRRRRDIALQQPLCLTGCHSRRLFSTPRRQTASTPHRHTATPTHPLQVEGSQALLLPPLVTHSGSSQHDRRGPRSSAPGRISRSGWRRQKEASLSRIAQKKTYPTPCSCCRKPPRGLHCSASRTRRSSRLTRYGAPFSGNPSRWA